MVKRQVCGQLFVAHGAFDSRGERTIGLEQPKSPKITTVVVQTMFLNTLTRALLYGPYAAGSLSTFLRWRHISARHRFMNFGINRSIEEWKKVTWFNELSFLVHHIDRRVRMCTVGRRRSCGGYIIMWAMFYAHMRTHNPHRTIPDVSVRILNIVVD